MSTYDGLLNTLGNSDTELALEPGGGLQGPITGPKRNQENWKPSYPDGNDPHNPSDQKSQDPDPNHEDDPYRDTNQKLKEAQLHGIEQFRHSAELWEGVGAGLRAASKALDMIAIGAIPSLVIGPEVELAILRAKATTDTVEVALGLTTAQMQYRGGVPGGLGQGCVQKLRADNSRPERRWPGYRRNQRIRL